MPACPMPRLGCVAVLTTLLFTGNVSGQESMADVIQRAERSVVRIEVRSDAGDSLGSGFVIDNAGTIITNCHVLAGANSATAFFQDGRSAAVEGTMIIDATRDIIVARIAINSAPPIPVSPGFPRKGESVTALGAPKGLAFTATQGIVSAIRSGEEMENDVGREEIQGTWIQVDTPISPGNSGGPLINSSGTVVAMSTLASQGSAQNLNFGISSKDISRAIRYAEGVQPVPLRSAAAKIRMPGSDQHAPSGGGPGSPGSIVNKEKVPDEVLTDYVKRGIEQFRILKRGISAEATRMRADLKEMRSGSPIMPPQLATRGATIVRAKIPGQRFNRWYFRSQSLKDSTINRQQAKIRKYNLLSREIKSTEDPNSVKQLLWNFGPPIDTRKPNSIGWATDLIVAHAFNIHDVIVIRDDVHYLMWAESTSGLGAGQILAGPVFVRGVTTADIGDGLTMSVTILQEITEDDLMAAVQRVVGELDAFRTWTSTSGTTVEAKLLDHDAGDVILRKRDGKVITVPRTGLSQSDRDFVDRQ